MKREGRQHGMVRTHCILPSITTIPGPRKAKSLPGGPPPAGVFVRVPSKPTNHSKFTGKCRRPGCLSCHLHPSSKSKDKTKGSSKLRSPDSGSGLQVVLDELHDYTHLGRYRRDQDDEEEEVQCDDLNVSTGCCKEVDDSEFYDVTFSFELFDGLEFEGWSLVGQA